MGTAPAEQLRHRARRLRQLAASVTVLSATSLHLRAGGDTWIGPLAARCLDDLLTFPRELTTAHDELLDAARRLDQRAAQLEAAKLLPERVA